MTVFICKDCVFLCNYESDYKRHLKTKKHIKNTENTTNSNVSVNKNNTSKMNKKNSNKNSNIHERCESEDKFLIRDTITNSHVVVDVNIKSDTASLTKECDDGIHECECGKIFKSSSGLRKHKRHLCCTKDNIIMKLIKDNVEMKELMREQQKFMREQQEQYHKQLVEMIPMVCATNNTNLITNNHNHMSIKQKFNLNVFLNEQCKDALNIGDFINSLQITLDDLSVTREKTLEDSVENIFLRGLKELDIYKRPIHCTDAKRETMYIKNDEWEKDDKLEHVRKFIYLTSCYQTRVIQDWMAAHPGWESNEKLQNEYLTLCKELYKNIENDDVAQRKILKGFIKEVQIDKSMMH